MISNIPQQGKKYKEIALLLRQIVAVTDQEKLQLLIYDYSRKENLSQKK